MIRIMSIDPVILTFLILALIIIPIFALMIYAIVVALKRSTRLANKRDKEISESTDESQVELFINIYGGEENIIDVQKQMSRISVTVLEIDKVEAERLKDLGANGVLLVGNVVKASFGDRALYIYNILNKGNKKND